MAAVTKCDTHPGAIFQYNKNSWGMADSVTQSKIMTLEIKLETYLLWFTR